MNVILAVDRGNSRTKLGLFSYEGEWLRGSSTESGQASDLVLAWVKENDLTLTHIGWLSTSQSWNPVEWHALVKHTNPVIHLIHAELRWPLAHRYQTLETLGADRFAAIVAACNLAPGHPVLVVDAGTAITYDVATANPEYLGGAISPGIGMRYEALHQFTARLPRITRHGQAALIGDSTNASIRSGVEYAVVKEVQGMIDAYREEMGTSLRVFLTGGDGQYFEKQLKNVNFADALLVLRGIYFIIKHIASI